MKTRLMLIAFAVALAAMPALATVYYVDGTSGSDGANGQPTWGDAFQTVTHALAQANSSDEIWVAKGTYSPGGSATSYFNMKSGVALYGGFTNGGSMADRDWTNNAAILDGGSLSYHVVYCVSQTNVVLDGFTIKGGKANGGTTWPLYAGGGVYAEGGSFAILNCLVTNNTANYTGGYGHGGGMAFSSVTDPAAIVSNCTIVGNTANASGIAGGVYLSSCTYPTFKNCTIRSNTGGYSGGMYESVSKATVDGCTFVNNTAGSALGGGGLYLGFGGVATVTGCTFTGNSAPGAGGGGGAIKLYYNSTATVFCCSFAGNTTAGDGGAVYGDGSSGTYPVSVRIYSCGFTNNTATGNGGALYIKDETDPDAIVSNCTFTGNYTSGGLGGAAQIGSQGYPVFVKCVFRANYALYGGGLFIYSGTMRECDFLGNRQTGGSYYGGGIACGFGKGVTLIGCTFITNSAYRGGAFAPYNTAASTSLVMNCSFSSNSATTGGGAIDVGGAGASTVFVTNCILWGDSPSELTVLAGSATVAYSDVQGNYTGTGNTNVNPLYANAWSDLHEKSAAGRWTSSGWVYDAASSPCIDAGDTNSPYSNELPPNGGRINMGAYGNTEQASKTLGLSLTVLASDGAFFDRVLVAWNTDPSATGYKVFRNTSNVFASATSLWTGSVTNMDDLTALPDTNYYYWVQATNAIGVTGFGSDAGYRAAIYYVRTNGSDTADGLNWPNAVATLTTALARAVSSNDQVWVAAGTYSPGAAAADSINLKSFVSVYGGFTNGGSMADRNWTNNETILDGANVNYHVVKCLTNVNAVLDGFTVKRGNANGSGWDIYGGGVFIMNGSPTIANCLITNNTFSYGGALYAFYVDPSTLVSNCVIAGNPGGASSTFGAIYCQGTGSSWLRLKQCAIRNNSVWYYGGGIGMNAGQVIAEGCEFRSNSGHYRGGAVGVYWSSLAILSNCAFIGNSAAVDYGGAINTEHSSTAWVYNCTFTGNAGSGGGAIANYADTGNPSVVIVTNSILWGDTAPEIYNTMSATVGYSDVQGAFAGTSNLNVDPLFAVAGSDVHLKSKAGRWTAGGWVHDRTNSPCIDQGDPTAVRALEPQPNGNRLNMGSEGNTVQASKTGTLTVNASDGASITKVAIGWSVDPSATGYQILRNTTNNSTAATSIWSGTGTNYDDTTATPDVTYYYFVLSTNASGTADLGWDTGYRAAVYYVRTNGNDAADGLSWPNAFATITNALVRPVNSNAQIWVAAGTYSPGGANTSYFNLKSYVALYGGFTNGGNMADRNWTNNETILDGASVSYHVVQSLNATNAILDGFTIKRGNAANASVYFGGGMYISGGSPQVYNCFFTNNTASSSGRGGAIYTDGVTDTNSAVSNCVFAGNTATFLGGAAYPNSAYPAFRNCVFRSNSATSYGGAAYAVNGIFSGCQFIGNGSQYGGGICNAWGAGMNVVNCTFVQNTGSSSGGGIYLYAGEVSTVVNCSFSGNTGGTLGGAIALNDTSMPCTLYVTNCIMWGDSTPETYVNGGTLTVRYSDVQGSLISGTGNTNVNPQYASATDLHEKSRAGRWTPAGWVSDATQSPCIDAGDASPCGSEPAPNGGHINMGAYGNTAQASKSSSMTVSATDGTLTDEVRLTWSAAASATGYQLWRSASVFDTAVNLWNGSALSYDDMAATAGTFYYYWVIATNASGIIDAGSDFGYRSAVYYVRTNGDDTADGLSWGTALATVTNALAKIPAGQIWVAAGTYSPGALTNSSFFLKSYVTLYGGFTNGGSMADRNWTNNETILDGANVNYHVVQSLRATNAVLDGFTVQRGWALGAALTFESQGAGMYINAGSPCVYNCLFTNNTVVNGITDSRGGALTAESVVDASSVVSNCTFTMNSAYMCGGGVYLSGCSFPTFRQCTFRANTVKYYGGGAYWAGSSALIDGCTFIGNQCQSGPAGGLYHGWGTVARVSHSAFIGNSAASYGGGVDVYYDAASAVVNCSFSGNTGLSGGSGVYVEHFASHPAAAYVTNCIIWGGSSPRLGSAAGSSITVAYSDVQGSFAGTSNIDVNPLYADAASDLHEQSHYGRWTPDGWVKDPVGSNSPCIDQGEPTMDRSQEPFFNGNRINMGAYGNTPQASKSYQPSPGTILSIR